MDHVETMARAMCRADGHDPDAPIAPPRPENDEAPSPAPRWRAYEAQARRLVEAQAALLAGP